MVKNFDYAGLRNVVTKKRSLLSQESDNFASISDKIKNAPYRSTNHKFSQSLERMFRSIVSSCLRMVYVKNLSIVR